MIKKQDNIIIWQKWIDPFGDDEISEILSSNVNNEDSDEPKFFENDDDDDEEERDIFKIDKEMPILKKHIKVITTPMGIIPVTENTVSSKIFNFWVGHCNFDITPKLALLIEQIDGIETLDIFTRYRFRIGVGKAFIDSDIMRNINDKVYNYLESSL